MHHSPFLVWAVHLLLSALSVFVVAKVLPGISVKSYGSAVWFAFVAGILNVIAWKILAPFSVTFSVLTLGLGLLIINGLLFLIAGRLSKGVEISGCITAAIASLGVSFLNWLMHFFLGSTWAP